MVSYYSDEKNAQIVIALLKAHGIRRVIASPGTTNMALVASMQTDSHFIMYSAVDERSAAYMACGLAAEVNEPVVLSCTGATASRNYLPGLTEAYYRKLPVLAITSMPSPSKVGHNIAQIIDRSVLPKDVAQISVSLPIVKDEDDWWECEIKVNRAILELRRHGGGPAHINLPTVYSRCFDVKVLPQVRAISRVVNTSKFPDLPEGRVAVFLGAHLSMPELEIELIDRFCESNNAVVFHDHTSNYKGKYGVLFSLVAGQQMFDRKEYRPDIFIHIGEITGDYYTIGMAGQEVWRVSEDGELRDTFRKLRFVFEMPEKSFFQYYSNQKKGEDSSYYQICKDYLTSLSNKIPELPYSNIWIASRLAPLIPKTSSIHFGILNSLRSWNFFPLDLSIKCYSNVGGFGIDGGLSSLIGASFSNPEKLFFGVIGDLAFFYDMNSLGNRHIRNNVRILMVNNGKGTEFKQFFHPAAIFGGAADEFIAAAGHFGNKSKDLVKHYAQDLGFEYLFADNKSQFEEVFERFVSPDKLERPILFEVFTDDDDENEALEIILNLEQGIKANAKRIVRNTLGDGGVNFLKRVLK